jgi:hypothetical protein
VIVSKLLLALAKETLEAKLMKKRKGKKKGKGRVSKSILLSCILYYGQCKEANIRLSQHLQSKY